MWPAPWLHPRPLTTAVVKGIGTEVTELTEGMEVPVNIKPMGNSRRRTPGLQGHLRTRDPSQMSAAFQRDGFEFDPVCVFDGNYGSRLEFENRVRRAELVNGQRIVAVQ